MWPFGRRGVAHRLAELEDDEEPAEVELLVVVVSANSVVSPLSGVRAAIVHVQIEELLTEEEAWRRFGWREQGARASLGEIVYGDRITCRDQDGAELSFVARRACFRFSERPRASRSLAAVPPDLAPSMNKPQGGALSYREYAVVEGERLRLQAIVERTYGAVTLGYRSSPRSAFFARDDLAPVFLMRPDA